MNVRGDRFPKDFTWGAATASYQIEGAVGGGGRGVSIWDVFSHTPGRVRNNETGDVACDHYHRLDEDVALMKSMGLQAYRFSIAWPRIMPSGTGKVNPKGVGFYDRLVDALLAAGIEPYATLYHWDLPHELHCRGGWMNRDSAEWFADYVRVVVAALSDRVRHWMTLNEPSVFVGCGCQSGVHAPGEKLDVPALVRMIHNVQRAHAAGVVAARGAAAKPIRIGIAPAHSPRVASRPGAREAEAARTANLDGDTFNVFNDGWWLDPILLGRWPERMYAALGQHLPESHERDLRGMHPKLDFLGLNTYYGHPGRIGKHGKFELDAPVTGEPLTRFNWQIIPESLYLGPKRMYERYRLPIYITENGLSSMDWVCVDGQVHDAMRIDFLTRYLRELRRAIGEGVDVRGYFHWSLMDNFEWSEGYRERFGLVHVDFKTLRRTPKDSAFWYRDVIASNGATL